MLELEPVLNVSRPDSVVPPSLSYFPGCYLSKSGYNFPIIRFMQWSCARKKLPGSFRREHYQLKVIGNFLKTIFHRNACYVFSYRSKGGSRWLPPLG